MWGKKNFILIFFIISILIIGIGSYLYFYTDADEQYSDITDLSNEYNVNNEIENADEMLEKGVKPAGLYTDMPDKLAVVLTIDGLPDPVTTDRILDLLDKYNVKATFFVEGSTASKNIESIKKIYQHKYLIGNYGYVGLEHLEKMSKNEILNQLLKTQKVIDVIAGYKPELFKGPKIQYNMKLLKIASAAGLKAGVKNTVYVDIAKIKTEDDALSFIDMVKPGSIISIPVSLSVEQIKYKPGKTDDTPAVDKQPNLAISSDTDNKHQDIVDVLEKVLKAIKAKEIKVVPITDFEMKDVNKTDSSKISFKFDRQIKYDSIVNKLFGTLDSMFFSTAYASEKYDLLRQQNSGREENTIKLILTTQPAVAFSFAGLTKPDVVYDILDRLKKMNATGTFFVMKNDINTHPDLIKAIINSGNEVGIGIRALENSNFDTTCAEIDYVRTKLESMGADPKLAMQPWGKITDDTREAVAAENLKLIGHYVNIVNSDMKDYTSPEEVMANTFGKFTYSLGRGWIVFFRLDYYADDSLVGKVMDLVKRKKIDNVAYNSFYDDPKININNDSQYQIRSVGEILNNKRYRYNFVSKNEIPQQLQDDYSEVQEKNINFKQYIKKRYIGNMTVGIDNNALGFSNAEMKSFDMTGKIHTKKPVIFFTFDDWGTDESINRLLYVLRKHKVKATFFILTRNVLNNPNLLRAIAEEGHDIGAHSDMHKPMTTQTSDNKQRVSSQSKSEYMHDLSECYKKLETITGDVIVDGHPVLTRYFRPPTLSISKMGFECLYKTHFTYIVDGSYSTHDYDKRSLITMIDDIKNGIFDENGHVQNGAVLVMHMSDSSEYTAVALDMILTANEQRKDGDPAKFETARLSEYLKNDYDQSDPKYDYKIDDIGNSDYDKYLYKNSGYNIGR